MRFNDLKAALQPSMDDDLGTLYARFVREAGTGDLVRFIDFLKSEGLVDPKVLADLVSDGVIDTSAVQDLARRNTPKPAGGRLHAPTIMPPDEEADEDWDDVPPVIDDEDDAASAVGETDEGPATAAAAASYTPPAAAARDEAAGGG